MNGDVRITIGEFPSRTHEVMTDYGTCVKVPLQIYADDSMVLWVPTGCEKEAMGEEETKQ
jgi:hypothetical protein